MTLSVYVLPLLALGPFTRLTVVQRIGRLSECLIGVWLLARAIVEFSAP
ncbi:MAG TPA: hypothetical protein VGB20_04400 [bacterium]